MKEIPNLKNSVTVQVYHNGFSILLTNRGEGQPLTLMLDEAVELIKYADETLGCKPSWNIATNGQHQAIQKVENSTQWLSEGELPDTQPCGICKGQTEPRNGETQKGYKWHGFKCLTGPHMGFYNEKTKEIDWKQNKYA